jgi:CII-binding regulator of phage lambda lysogenization HflD
MAVGAQAQTKHLVRGVEALHEALELLRDGAEGFERARGDYYIEVPVVILRKFVREHPEYKNELQGVIERLVNVNRLFNDIPEDALNKIGAIYEELERAVSELRRAIAEIEDAGD